VPHVLSAIFAGATTLRVSAAGHCPPRTSHRCQQRWTLSNHSPTRAPRQRSPFQPVAASAPSLLSPLAVEIRALASLANLLSVARRSTRAQAGTVYRREADGLRFLVTQNDELARLVGHAATVELLTRTPLRWTERSIASYVALSGATLNIPDVYRLGGDQPYSFNSRLDAATGFRTVSMLVMPLHSPIDGVLQLINATNEHGEIVPFSRDAEQIVLRELLTAAQFNAAPSIVPRAAS
jgi:hypothetical protein